MADFIYKFGGQAETDKFNTLYNKKIILSSDFKVFYNDGTIIYLTENNDCLILLGYAYKSVGDIDSYLHDLLTRFSVDRISQAKKDLSGQYIVIIVKNNQTYIFSDFLQVRSIYYNSEQRTVCSSFPAINGSKTNDYKVFEFKAMKYCVYPSWLGNTTMDDRIRRVRGYEFLKINSISGEIEVCPLQYHIDNRKVESLDELTSSTLLLLRKMIDHPAMRDKKVASTITGGFDSRLVTALVKEYYNNVHLRIAVFKDAKSLDYEIASEVAKRLSSELESFETDFDKQIDEFYFLTDGLAPQENSVMTQLLKCSDSWNLGFGGAFGTELYTTFDQKTTDELIEMYVHNARCFVKAEESHYIKFKKALQDEFCDLREHYLLSDNDDRDLMRIFRLNTTAFFSSTINSAYNIYGNQFEVFGTFLVIEAGLRVPYNHLGGHFGRFYIIPKTILNKINPKISKMQTTHFCPMRPLSFTSFVPYVIGKMRQRVYYRHRAKNPGRKFQWDEGLEKIY